MSTDPESQKPTGAPKTPGTDDIVYESGMKPALWVLIPFVLVLLYGFLSN